MAQATNAMNVVNGEVEVSYDGSEAVWTDISGFANKLIVSAITRATGDAFTADGDYGIVKAGKFQPVEITYTVLYTEGASDPFTSIYAAFKAKKQTSARWSPAGGAIGTYQFQSDPGPIVECSLPNVDPDEAGAHMFTFKLRVSGIDAPTTILA
jgi:hypothetical protein